MILDSRNEFCDATSVAAGAGTALLRRRRSPVRRHRLGGGRPQRVGGLRHGGAEAVELLEEGAPVLAFPPKVGGVVVERDLRVGFGIPGGVVDGRTSLDERGHRIGDGTGGHI